MATKTENTAVNRLIEMAGTRPFEADDALFSSPPPARKTLPKPFPARIGAPVDPPAPLPRARTPHSTQTNLAAVTPASQPGPQEEISTRPFDQIELDPELLDSVEDEVDDDLPITVAEEAAPVRGRAPAPIPVAPAPAAIPPLTIGPVEPLAARPSALGAIPGTDEANWFEESVGIDRVDEASLSLRGPARASRYRTMLWLSAAFAAGLVATAVVAWPGRTGATKLSSAIAKQPAPATAPAPAPAVVTPSVVPVTDGAAAPTVVEPVATEPAVVEPLPAEPAVVEPVAVEPAVVEPAVPTQVTVHLDSEPSGATVLVVDSGTTVTLGVTPLDQPLDPSRTHEIMFTMSGHRSTLVTVDPSASQRVTVDLASSKAVAQPAPAAPAAAPRAVRSEPTRKAERPAKVAKPVKAPRVAATSPAKATSGGRGTLMLGAKPPCDIFIDGKATGLKTPQRGLKVAPGAHKVTLVNREHRITETFSVTVKDGTSTKVVKDLTRRMK
jgi:hypothetical protein